MKRITVIILIIISVSSCIFKKEKNAEPLNETANDTSQTVIYYEQAPIVTERKEDEPKLTLIDSFEIGDYCFLTIESSGIHHTINDTLKWNTYLVNISKDTLVKYKDESLERIINKCISSHWINGEPYSDFFFNVTGLFHLNTITIKHSYPFPVMNSSENAFFFLDENGLITKWFTSGDWTDYGTGLTPIKINDSILCTSYSSRDSLGFFHSDYKVHINIRTLNIKHIYLKNQGFKLSGVANNNFTLYESKEEARDKVILSDTMTIIKGTKYKFDSVYWNLDVFRIIIPEVDTGYVNMNQEGFKTPQNNQG